jgi:homeobox protein cut-like
VQLEIECDRLSNSLENQKSELLDAELASQKKADELAKEVSIRNAEIEQLRSKVKQRSDYDEIKRELDIMKFVEFSGLNDDGDGADTPPESLPNGHSSSFTNLQLPNPNADKANGLRGKSLEALLATKNKKIMEELTKFRILHNDLEASLRAAEERIQSTASELERQKELNEKLETDLFSVNQQQAEIEAQPPSQTSADILSGLNIGKKPSSDTPSRATPIPFTSSADTSILPIVTSQRDRFRQRNAELEEVYDFLLLYSYLFISLTLLCRN